jgi:hypothetical protein
MQNFFESVILRLAEGQVEFVVVGGVSGALQGSPLATFDLDICFRHTAENCARLAKAIAPLHPRLRDFPPDLPFVLDERALMLGTNFTLTVDGGDLDLLTEMIGIGGYEQATSDCIRVDIQGYDVQSYRSTSSFKRKRLQIGPRTGPRCRC